MLMAGLQVRKYEEDSSGVVLAGWNGLDWRLRMDVRIEKRMRYNTLGAGARARARAKVPRSKVQVQGRADYSTASKEGQSPESRVQTGPVNRVS